MKVPHVETEVWEKVKRSGKSSPVCWLQHAQGKPYVLKDHVYLVQLLTERVARSYFAGRVGRLTLTVTLTLDK